MTIKGLQTDQPGLPRAGIIRLGHKKTITKNGKEVSYPVESPHFVLTDAPDLADALGTAEPTELKIYFPFDDINLVFPAYMQFWQASSLVCRGDGEQIIYAIEPATGKAKVRDGIALFDFTEGREQYKAGQFMACPGTERNLYPKCLSCKPNAMLIVLLRDVPRLAYYQISTTSIHNIVDLTKQLNNIRDTLANIIGTPRLTGVPFILKRVARKVSTPRKDKNGNDTGRQRVEKYFLELEIDPDWVLSLLRAQRRLAEPRERGLLPATVPTPQMDIIDSEPSTPQKPPFGFADPPKWEASIDEEEIEAENETPQPDPSPAPVTTEAPKAPVVPNGKAEKLQRPLTAIQVRDGLRRRIEGDDNSPATKAQVGLVAGKLEEAFAPDKGAKGKRLTVLHWLWNIESAKELTFKQAKVTLDWLLSGQTDSGGDHSLHPSASEEAQRIYHEATPAAGQAEMSLEEAEEGQLGLFEEEELDKLFPGIPGGVYQD